MLWGILVSVYIYLTLAFSFLVTWIVQVSFKYLSWFFISTEAREDLCGLIFRSFSHFFVTVVNPLWHIHRLNKFPKVENKKVMVMMNHLSSADPFIACGSFLPRDGSWIAKHDLFKVPVGGWLMHNAGDLPVIFKRKGSGFDVVKGTVRPMMELARQKICRGRMLCVYPEGTRNAHPDGDLCPFRLGFFQLAIEEEAAIVPMAISGTHRIWPLHGLCNSGHAYVSFGEPIEVKGFTDAQQLADHVWKIISDLREKHPDRIKRALLSKKKE